MIQTFTVSLSHFVIQDGKAVAKRGTVRLGVIGLAELREVLLVFSAIDVVQEFAGEPEVAISTRGDKWAVRSDLHRLILYDQRNPTQPGIVYTVEQLLLEVNESAMEERQAHAMQVIAEESAAARELSEAPMDSAEVLPEAEVVGIGRRLRTIGLLVAAVVMLSGVVFFVRLGESPSEQGYRSVETNAEREALVKLVVGVYMTGTRAGQHGIVVQQDGGIKLFQLNGSAPPSFVNDAYRLWEKGGRIFLGTKQPGGFVAVLDKDTLEYCREQYKRVP